jgi:hypothetical protein
VSFLSFLPRTTHPHGGALTTPTESADIQVLSCLRLNELWRPRPEAAFFFSPSARWRRFAAHRPIQLPLHDNPRLREVCPRPRDILVEVSGRQIGPFCLHERRAGGSAALVEHSVPCLACPQISQDRGIAVDGFPDSRGVLIEQIVSCDASMPIATAMRWARWKVSEPPPLGETAWSAAMMVAISSSVRFKVFIWLLNNSEL